MGQPCSNLYYEPEKPPNKQRQAKELTVQPMRSVKAQLFQSPVPTWYLRQYSNITSTHTQQ
eukprot:9250866-Ditylum_brightwellii.AAC.1